MRQEAEALMLFADSANDDGQVRAVKTDHIADVMPTTPATVEKILRGLHQKGFLQTYAERIQIRLDML